MTRVAIVTGGAQGIGSAIAARLAADGYRVVVADADAEAGREAARTLGPAVRFVRCDVADEAQVRACVKAALAGGRRLDALVNNAALARPARVPVTKLPLATWNRTLAVNLTGAFLMAKHAAPHLRRARARSSTSLPPARCSPSRTPRPIPPPTVSSRSRTRSPRASDRQCG